MTVSRSGCRSERRPMISSTRAVLATEQIRSTIEKKPLWRKVLLSLRWVGVEEKERICSIVSYDGKHRLLMTIWRWSFLPHLIEADKTPLHIFCGCGILLLIGRKK